MNFKVLGTVLRPFMTFVISSLQSQEELNNRELERLSLRNDNLYKLIDYAIDDKSVETSDIFNNIIQIYISLCILILKEYDMVDIEEKTIDKNTVLTTVRLKNQYWNKDVVVVVSDDFETEFCGVKPDIIIPKEMEL